MRKSTRMASSAVGMAPASMRAEIVEGDAGEDQLAQARRRR